MVANTIIDGARDWSVVIFDGTEHEICILSGFTITNGLRSLGIGAGIRGTTDPRLERDTHATIRNNVIAFNEAYCGGGISDVAGTIRNNVVRSNIAEDRGGGLFACSGLVTRNLIAGNFAGEGGGLLGCEGTVSENRIIGNSAGTGGGISNGPGIILNNLIAGNFASTGGGVASYETTETTLVNNAIVGNSASYRGGAVRGFPGLTGETTIKNCIIWGNQAPSGPQIYSIYPAVVRVTHCCIQDWTEGGEGNIADDPRFVKGGYRLKADSPCIDAGKNEHWMWDAVDLDGNPRIFYGKSSKTVDMGAYEYGSWPFRIVDVASAADAHARLTWKSRPADTYIIWSSSSVSAGLWNMEETIPSGGETTIWSDTDTTSTRKFYRIEIQ